MKNLIVYLIIFFAGQNLAWAQKNINIGEQIGGLAIQNVEHFDKKQITTKDLLGKWTILDFWTTACTSCVQSFPKINELQSKFPQIQFILITDNGKHYPNARQTFERFRKNMKLELAIAYDSLLFKKLEIMGVPFIVVLDPEGKVYAMPYGNEITEDNLNRLLSKRNPYFTGRLIKRQIWKHWVDPNELDSVDEVYHSILTPYRNEWTSGQIGLDSNFKKGLYQVTRVNAVNLFMVASDWWGLPSPFKNDYWRVPVLELSSDDKSLVEKFNKNTLFNYSLLMPKANASSTSIKKELKSNLESYFGAYASVEIRNMPYWSLTATPEASNRLLSKASEYKYSGEPTGLDGCRVQISNIIELIYLYFDADLPIVDETNITHLIDISFEAVMTDVNQVRKALKKQGLLLEQKTKPMKVLVIKDGPNPNMLTSKLNSNEQ